MEPSARRTLDPAGAGGILLGILLAAIFFGALIGAVAGIPLAVYSVYRRYRGAF